MKIVKTSFKDVLIIENIKHFDNRGYFFELIGKKISLHLKNTINKNISFVQINFSFSKNKNTLRGLHIQKKPNEQAKLVFCNKGRIIDFVVDVRKNSKTFGKYLSFELTNSNNKMIFIPSGCLHGFLTKMNNCEVVYAASNFYSKKSEININFFDNYFNFKELKRIKKFKMSLKDKKGRKFNDIKKFF